MINKLKTLMQGKNLVSIERDDKDEQSIHGFILAYSDELILLQYVYDFTLDGLLVLRVGDITSIESDEIDVFQTQLLKDEGIYANVDFSQQYDVKDWPAVFSSLGKAYGFISLDDEDLQSPNFLLGELREIGEQSVSVLGFNGMAGWDEEASQMYYEDISYFQVGNNYAKVYKRYFERNA